MSRPKNPNLQGELEEFKKRDAKRLNREGYPDKSYAERVHREMDMNRALKNRGTPIQKARQGMVPKYDRARYVAENGIDSADRGLSKNEFNRRVGATVTRNLLQQAFREKAKKK